jgi:16S rRNA C967 or C1407 C5-methylase (RsmB/RsmF family)
VYATCALTGKENDGVIERLVSRGRHAVEILEPVDAASPPPGERTGFGWRLLPDECALGPSYFAVMQRPRS